jgi:hypothetical protein
MAAVWRNRRYVVLALVLTAAVFWAQILLFDRGLDNQILNPHAPTFPDAVRSVDRAVTLAGEGGFSGAFADGRMMPGYPLFLSLCVSGFSQPLLVARFVQVFLASLIVPFAFLTLCLLFKSQGWALLGSVAFALWVPFYYFSPILSAETLSMFYYALLCYQLARSHQTQSRMHLLMMVVLAVMVYLMPGLVLLFIPFAAVMEYRRGGGGKGVTVVGPLAVVVVLLLPWTIWVSVKNQAFVPLTTTSGYQLYFGTGVTAKVDTTGGSSRGRGMPAASAEALGLADAGLVSAVARDTVGASPVEKNRIFRRAALGVWVNRPGKMISYGAAKVLHAFGFSFRNARDSLLAALLAGSLLLSALLWSRRLHREWCVYLWVVTGVVALQAFVLVPSQRYKTVLFDFPAVLIVALGVVEMLRGGTGTREPESR